MTFRDVLPLGVTYAGNTTPVEAGEPQIFVNFVEQPAGSGEFVSQQTLIWANVADLQSLDSYELEADRPSCARPKQLLIGRRR